MTETTRCLRVILSVFILSVWVPAVDSAPPPGPINPGKWEMTTRAIEPTEGLPVTTVSCITADSIARIKAPVSKVSDDCTVVSAGFAGGVLSYIVNCPKLNRRTITKMTFSGDTLSGSMTIEANGQTALKQTIEGKRLGDCDDSQP